MTRAVAVRRSRRSGTGVVDQSETRLRDAFLAALVADYEMHGAEAIAALRTEKPVDYMKLVASLLPKPGATAAEEGADGEVPIAIEVRFVSPGG
jgi:hypothetical protein